MEQPRRFCLAIAVLQALDERGWEFQHLKDDVKIPKQTMEAIVAGKSTGGPDFPELITKALSLPGTSETELKKSTATWRRLQVESGKVIHG